MHLNQVVSINRRLSPVGRPLAQLVSKCLFGSNVVNNFRGIRLTDFPPNGVHSSRSDFPTRVPFLVVHLDRSIMSTFVQKGKGFRAPRTNPVPLIFRDHFRGLNRLDVLTKRIDLELFERVSTLNMVIASLPEGTFASLSFKNQPTQTTSPFSFGGSFTNQSRIAIVTFQAFPLRHLSDFPNTGGLSNVGSNRRLGFALRMKRSPQNFFQLLFVSTLGRNTVSSRRSLEKVLGHKPPHRANGLQRSFNLNSLPSNRRNFGTNRGGQARGIFFFPLGALDLRETAVCLPMLTTDFVFLPLQAKTLEES